MRKLIPVLFAVLGGLQATAQKVDMDRYWFTTSNRSLPSNPLPEGSRTYRVEVTNSSVVSSIYSNDAIKSSLPVDGFKYTEPMAHLNISIFFSDMHFENSSISERKEDIKDKDGKITGTRSYFSVKANYRFGVDISIKDSTMREIERQQPYSTNILQSYSSQEFATYNDAAKYFNGNLGEIKRNQAKLLVDNALGNLRGTLRAKYGYPVSTYRDFLWILDSKKHPEYKQQQEYWDTFKAISAKLNGAENIADNLREELKPIMAYFDSLRLRFAGDEEKTNKKFRHCSYYAMGRIYLLLDNPEAALKEADLLVANGFDVKDAEGLKRDANTMIDRFAKNNINSTHFPLNSEINRPPVR